MERKFSILGLIICTIAEIGVIWVIIDEYKLLMNDQLNIDQKLEMSDNISVFSIMAALLLILIIFFSVAIYHERRTDVITEENQETRSDER
jgi:hypothetical protein